jgi:transmembrane sensor
MSEIVKLRTRADIDEEAAAWIWRMDSAAIDAADRQAFEAWQRQDPRHRRAVSELSAVWDALDGLAEAKREEKIATFANTAKAARRHHPQRWWMAAAAALAAVAVGVGALWLQRGSELQTLSTAVGQQRNVTLADGSVVTLNTNTIVESDLRHRTREIYLLKGEAHFQVAHDRSRPFLVHAGDAVVRAVGTAFEVRVLADQHVDVVVNEGRRTHRPRAQCGGTPVHRQPRLRRHPRHRAAIVHRTRMARRRDRFRRRAAVGRHRRDRTLHRCAHHRQRSGCCRFAGGRPLPHGQCARVL